MVRLSTGVDFRERLTEAVSGCDLVAVISERWLTISSNTGVRRLANEKAPIARSLILGTHGTLRQL